MTCITTPFDERIGIGLRAPHMNELMGSLPPIGWLEIHSENWMTDEGPVAERLHEIGAEYPLSLHGVGLSLGSADGLDIAHLRKLGRLAERCRPVLVSEHLGWGRIGSRHSNDLLPLPFNQASVSVLVQHIDQVQQYLGRRILVENLSSYCTFESSTLPEWIFVREVVERADCGLLLDLNNVFVNASNHGFSTRAYLAALPWQRVEEIHLAGFEEEGDSLIDTHSRPVQAPVWQLYAEALKSVPEAVRTLIEWDSDLPPLSSLLEEARTANSYLREAKDATA